MKNEDCVFHTSAGVDAGNFYWSGRNTVILEILNNNTSVPTLKNELSLFYDEALALMLEVSGT